MSEVFIAVLSAAFAAGGAYAAVRIELKFLWREIEKLEKRLGKLEAI